MTPLKVTLDSLRNDLVSAAEELEIPSTPIEQTYVSAAQVRMALSLEGEPLLLLPANKVELGKKLPIANGLDFSIVRYGSPTAGHTNFIQIKCLLADLENTFLDIIENICNRIREGGAATACITAAIDDFREILDDGKLEQGKEAAIGLFGELLLLEKALQINPDAVTYWTGVDKNRRDFSFPKLFIEVKTSQRTHQRQVSIHALDQLATTSEETLYLWYFSIEDNPGSGDSIPDLVGRIEKSLTNAKSFKEALKKAGYTHESSDQWGKWQWSVLESQAYTVNEQFPKIINASFPGGAPAGISHVTYQVNLDNAEPCRIEEPTVLEYIAL